MRVSWAVVFMLISSSAGASQWENSPTGIGLGPDGPIIFRECVLGAATMHHVPPMVLLTILDVEGGKLGRVTPNTNGTVDIGPFQVNDIWLPQLSAHWEMSVGDTFLVLRDNFCGNAETAAWILAQGLAEANGDLWGGVARYHSATAYYQQPYLKKVLQSARRMLAGSKE